MAVALRVEKRDPEDRAERARHLVRDRHLSQAVIIARRRRKRRREGLAGGVVVVGAVRDRDFRGRKGRAEDRVGDGGVLGVGGGGR